MQDSHNSINTFIILHIYLFFFWWEHKFYSLHFSIIQYGLSTIITMLYFRFSDLIHLTPESLCPFIILSWFPSSPTLWQPPFRSLFLWVYLFFFSFTVPYIRDNHVVFVFSVWLSSLNITSSRFTHRMARFLSFLRLINCLKQISNLFSCFKVLSEYLKLVLSPLFYVL